MMAPEQLPLLYVSGSDTSYAAALGIVESSDCLRSQVFRFLHSSGTYGATDEEMQRALVMNPSTQRPRRVELVRLGLVCDSWRRRSTDSGRSAVVWIARSILRQVRRRPVQEPDGGPVQLEAFA